MYPNVQTQLDGSRLETVNNEVVEQNPNSCGLICLYFLLKLFDKTKHLYVKSNLELIRVMSSFCKKNRFIEILNLFRSLISFHFQV